MLAPQRVFHADLREQLRREAGHAGVLETLGRRHGVAHAQAATVVQADHVAGDGVFAVGRAPGHELLGLREPERLAPFARRSPPAGLEATRADAHERDPVTVPQVHVRLHLEHEARERMVGRVDRPAVLSRAVGGGALARKRSRKTSTP
jgi:hypothetical protein